MSQGCVERAAFNHHLAARVFLNRLHLCTDLISPASIPCPCKQRKDVNARSSRHFLHGTFLDDGGVDGFCWRVQSETLVRETHLLCEGGVGLPGGGVAGVDLFHHLVDLFEREAFGFRLECDV